MTSWSTYGSLLPAGGCQPPYRVSEVCLLLAAPFFCGNQFPFPSGVEGDQPSNLLLALSGAVSTRSRSRSRVCNLSTSQLVEINHSDVILIADRSSQAVSLSARHL